MNSGREPETPISEPVKKILSPQISEALPHSVDVSPNKDQVEPSPDYRKLEDKETLKKEWEFLLHQHKYLSDYIRFADTKASFIFAFSLATLGFFFSEEVFTDLPNGVVSWFQIKPLFGIATALFVVSLVLSALAILPKLWKWDEEKRGLVFWEDVVKFGSANNFFEGVRKSSPDSLHSEICYHCYDLSLVCHGKYESIRYAVWTAAFGAVFTAFALF